MKPERPEQGRVQLVEIAGVAAEEREVVEPPKVNPKVTAKQAVAALEKWPGGKEVIEQLRKAGRKI